MRFVNVCNQCRFLRWQVNVGLVFNEQVEHQHIDGMMHCKLLIIFTVKCRVPFFLTAVLMFKHCKCSNAVTHAIRQSVVKILELCIALHNYGDMNHVILPSLPFCMLASFTCSSADQVRRIISWAGVVWWMETTSHRLIGSPFSFYWVIFLMASETVNLLIQ